MTRLAVSLAVCLFVVAGCTTTQYAAITSDSIPERKLQVAVADTLWNLAPGTLTGHLHPGSSLWTRDGILLDQLLLIGPVSHEETLFLSKDPGLAYPTFRKEMLPNEVQEIVVSTLTKHRGASTIVEATNTRPERINGNRAIAFDLSVVSNEGPKMKGLAKAFIDNGDLYLMVFMATDIYYFEKHIAAANAVMDSAQIAE